MYEYQNKRRLFPPTALTYRCFKIETDLVYCAVRAICLSSIIQINLSVFFVTYAHTDLGYFSPRVSPCGICGGQTGTGTIFFSEFFGLYPISIFPPLLHIRLHLHVARISKWNEWSVGTFQKAMLLWKSGSIWYWNTSIFQNLVISGFNVIACVLWTVRVWLARYVTQLNRVLK